MNNDILNLLSDLLNELASELDLHYEVTDAAQLTPTLDIMRRAASALEAAGKRVPDACMHVLMHYSQTSH